MLGRGQRRRQRYVPIDPQPPGDRDQWGGGLTYRRGPWTVSMDYMMVVIHGTHRDIFGQRVDFRKIRTNTVGLSLSRTF